MLGFSQTTPANAEPPVANRVEPFSGAVGRKFAVSTAAEPTELTVGETLTLTIRVTAEADWQHPPKRPDLRRHAKYARFPKQFHIENGEDRHDPAASVWEFVYRLRPLREDVTEVPRFTLVYYRPEQGYQTVSAPAIKLKVRPREEVTAAEVRPGPEIAGVPPPMLRLAERSRVLSRESPGVLPAPWLFGLVGLGAPLLCVLWYGVWRATYPEAARLARQRRSRAAQDALRSLSRAASAEEGQQAGLAQQALTDYLRSRFDLLTAEPTPQEVAAHLSGIGVPDETLGAVADFLVACDAARFAGAHGNGPEKCAERASQLILDLENAPCAHSSL